MSIGGMITGGTLRGKKVDPLVDDRSSIVADTWPG